MLTTSVPSLAGCLAAPAVVPEMHPRDDGRTIIYLCRHFVAWTAPG